MAYLRMVRIRGAIRGSSTAIEGVVSCALRSRLTYSVGKSGSDIGPTSMDVNGLEASLTLTSDSIATLLALSNHTTEAFVLKYTNSGGTARKRTYDNVKFGNISRVVIQQNPGQGNTVRFQVTGRVIFAAADTALSDAIAVAADT